MLQFMKRESKFMRNGLDTRVLGDLAAMLKDNPQAGRVSFRTHSEWRGGAQVVTEARGFTVDGSELHGDRRRFVLKCDEPKELGSTDAQAAPAEQLMHAVAGCIAATTNAYAALAGVTLTRIEVAVTCDIDLHGIFGMYGNVRPGIATIDVGIVLAGDSDTATLREIAEKGVRYSPMRDTVEQGTRVGAAIEVEKK